MKTLEQMQMDGLDIDGVMERFMNNEQMYRKYLGKFLEDTTYQELKTALEQNAVSKAFELAHSLKGLVSNLGIVSLYSVIYDMTEQLRAGDMPTDEMIVDLENAYDKWIKYIQSV